MAPTPTVGHTIRCASSSTSVRVASTGIDWYLARISEASNFFKRVIGKYTNYSAGNWVYYNTNAESSFIYFGTNTSLTNLYLEWAFSADKKLKGRAEVYLQGANNDFSKGFVSFDATVTVPVMEIYLAMNASKTIFSKFHIKLEKNADGYVIVTAKGILTNALTNSGTALGNKSAEPKVWDLVGVGKDSANGGVYAWAQGVATDINNDPRWDSSYDYKYNEFFSANSLVLWKLGVFVVNTIPDTNIYVTNKDGRFYYTNTSADLYTNNTKPADANTALIANTNKRLTSADYPSLTLYK